MKIKSFLRRVMYALPIYGTYRKLCHIGYDETGFSFKSYIVFRFFTRNKAIYWPKAETCTIKFPQNMIIGVNSVVFKKGNYIQGLGKLVIGKYVRFATNVGIITANHNIYNHQAHTKGIVEIGDYSWVGMNSVILPNVKLGPRTIVGAGSVVTKSFPEGFCVIGGNPAKKIKDLDPDKFVKPHYKYEAYGYILAEDFDKFKKKHLFNGK